MYYFIVKTKEGETKCLKTKAAWRSLTLAEKETGLKLEWIAPCSLDLYLYIKMKKLLNSIDFLNKKCYNNYTNKQRKEIKNMTKVSYVLSNGVEVGSYREAESSGLRYRTRYTPIPETPIKLTEKQKNKRIKI